MVDDIMNVYRDFYTQSGEGAKRIILSLMASNKIKEEMNFPTKNVMNELFGMKIEIDNSLIGNQFLIK